jgi:tRNA(Ile)-lysidine synthase
MNQKPTSDDREKPNPDLASRLHGRLQRCVNRWLKYRSDHHLHSSLSWVLALSGGPDSVALLNLMHHVYPERQLILAHMNHHARPGADDDEQFVRNTAANYHLPLEVGHWHSHRSSHFESDARTARHAWLADVAAQHKASAIFTAHTMDDQAETLLMRIARGTGPTGLSGIRPWRALGQTGTHLVRPLLKTTKQELLEYLHSQSLAYCIDPTNLDTGQQTRAWVRHDLLPLLQSRLNPHIHRALSQLADLVAEEQAGLARSIDRKTRRCAAFDHTQDSCQLNLALFRRSGPPWVRRLILRQIWTEMAWPLRDMSMKQWVMIHRWLMADPTQSHISRDCPGGVRIQRLGTDAMINRHDQTSHLTTIPAFRDHSETPFAWPGMTRSTHIVLETTFLPNCPPLAQVRSADPTQVAFLDRDTIQPPLLLRHPRAGDRFDPLGLGGHHQRLVDFLRIQGVLSPEKQRTWLLCDKLGIVCVVGHRVSHRVRISSHTMQTAQIRLIAHEGGSR